jgi:hypothetical protein
MNNLMFGIAMVCLALGNMVTAVKNFEQLKRIQCLEQGRIYVGNNFCADKE